MARQAYIVTDLGYGDAGKGSTVDYLVRQAVSAVVVRHNGGAQAAHNVVTPDGAHHTFAQFGSGSLVPGVKTHLSRFMVLNPLTMLNEGEYLEQLVPDIWQRVSVDTDALVTTPWHMTANRLRELARGDRRHGSCGLGVGETVADSLSSPELAIRARDLTAPGLARRLTRLRDFKFEQLNEELGGFLASQPETSALFNDTEVMRATIRAYREWAGKIRAVTEGYLKELSDSNDLLVFEGAQGVLLDEWYGFHPYTTWSTTTHANAELLLAETGFDGQVVRLGVMRGYTTRHGAGPFVTEDKYLTENVPDYHNARGQWQGDFRIGFLDLVAHRYAIDVCGQTDGLVVTGLDRLSELGRPPLCSNYRLDQPAEDAGDFFVFNEEGTIAAIKPGDKGDLDRQARLTELILSCSPVYRKVGSQGDYIDNLLSNIEEHLEVPVSITSFGPTWADKRALVAC
jgi:adenylosuccinate synthase